MKKYKLFILSIFMIIINFLFNWFYCEIIRVLPFWSSLISLLSFIIFIYLLISFTRKIINKENLLLNGISLCILIIYLIFKMCFPFIFIKSKLELNFYENKRIEVIEKIKDGEISSFTEKTIYLPEDYSDVAVGGTVSVYVNNENDIVIGFNVYSGGVFASDIEIIYSSIGSDEVYKITGIKEVKRLKENWYYVIVR